MAVCESYLFSGHRSIYENEKSGEKRKIRAEMALPDCVDENTGMLVLSPWGMVEI